VGFSLLGVWALGGACLPIAECPTLIFYMTRQTHISQVREEVREQLLQFMLLHGIEDLQELMQLPEAELSEMEGFGMRLLAEVHKLKQINLASPD